MTKEDLRYHVARGIGMIRAGEAVPGDWTFEKMWRVLSREIKNEGAQHAMMDYCGRQMSEYLDSHDAASREERKP